MKSLNKTVAPLALLALIVTLPVAAFAAISASDTPAKMTPAIAASAAATDTMSEGEVKKIDKDAGKITIKHGPLTNLQMPGMTMVFHVKDSGMLASVKVGDKIKFVAEKAGGALTVTTLQLAK